MASEGGGQKYFATFIHKANQKEVRLLATAHRRDAARVRSVMTQHATAWANTIPMAAEFVVPPPEMQVLLRWVLGLPLSGKARCSCGALSQPPGDHTMTCNKDGLPTTMHNQLRDVIVQRYKEILDGLNPLFLTLHSAGGATADDRHIVAVEIILAE